MGFREQQTLKAAEIQVQQRVDDDPFPNVSQEVDHHTAMSVCSCKPVGGVVLEAAQDSRLVRCVVLSALSCRGSTPAGTLLQNLYIAKRTYYWP